MKYLRGILTISLAVSAALPLKAADADELGDPLFQPETPQIEIPSKTKESAPAGSRKKASNHETLVVQAMQLEKKKDFEAIVKLLKSATDQLPRKGLLLLAKSYGETKDVLNEIRTLELCLAKSPKDYYVQTLLGEAYGRTKRSDEAIAAFQEAKQINPKFERAYDGLLGQLMKTADTYESRTLLNDMIKVFGKQPKYYSLLCRLYTVDAFLEKAVETCEKAIQMDSKVASNYLFLGLSLKDKEEPDRALEILTEGTKKFPNDEPVHSALGEIQSDKKNFPAAYKSFKQAVDSDGKSTKALIGLALSSFELQKYEESLSAFVRACSVDRRLAKEFRIAIGKLRARQETSWLHKFEDGIERCM